MIIDYSSIGIYEAYVALKIIRQKNMPEKLFRKASDFFTSFEKKPRGKLYNDLFIHRRKIVARMLEEERQGNLFGALTMFVALHLLGFGILHPDISTLLDGARRDVYPFDKMSRFWL